MIPDFSQAGLNHDPDTDELEFNQAHVYEMADFFGIQITTSDDIGTVLHQWYAAHRKAGGKPDAIAEELFWEALEEAESNFAWDLPVQPPIPQEIKQHRLDASLTQPQAAALCGVALRTWKGYETPLMSQHSRIPSPAVWGLFLLAIGQHPVYRQPVKK